LSDVLCIHASFLNPIDKIIVSQDKQIEIMWKFTPELRVVS